MVISYFQGVANEVRHILAKLGARSLQEIVGAVDRLQPRTDFARGVFDGLLETASEHASPSLEYSDEYSGVRAELLRLLATAKGTNPVRRRFVIANSDRSVGARFSGDLLRRARIGASRSRHFDFEFRGAAGQSFGAFLVSGVNFRLTGEANDYVGKGLSGGRIAITSGPVASRRGDVLAGNTVLYGATSGELYIAGRAGERFAVRNSGALAVVEGVGEHGCEYMTAGIVVVLGPIGGNFGSGMTGGLAYVHSDSLTAGRYHSDFLRPAAPTAREQEWLRRVLSEHFARTGSARAEKLLDPHQPLPLVRLEPVSQPWTLEETWATAITRLARPDAMPFGALDQFLSDAPVERLS
jgi:glutamate synthase domain-containing protein 3